MAEDPYQLYADELTTEDLLEVRSQFDCCGVRDDPWAKAANEWLFGEDVWASVARGTKVWVYRLSMGQIVGFGSMGTTRRRWPPPDGGYRNIWIIPMLGIDHRFHGQPKESEKYSHQVVAHLLYEAEQSLLEKLGPDRRAVMTLYVHKDNAAAIRLYQKFEFTVEPAAGRDSLLLMTRPIQSKSDK